MKSMKRHFECHPHGISLVKSPLVDLGTTFDPLRYPPLPASGACGEGLT